jgi:type II secretory pathway pseudopilin PulG
MCALQRQSGRCNWRIGGFTLIEVMMGVMIIMIAIVGTFAYFTYGRTALDLAGHKRIAAEIASARLEEMRGVAYAKLLTKAETDTVVSMGEVDGKRSTIITDVDEDNDGKVDYRVVTARVTWLKNGRTQTVELVTIRSQYR